MDGLTEGSRTDRGGAGLGMHVQRSITIPSVAVGRGLESAQIWRLSGGGFLGNIQATEPEDNFRAQVMGGQAEPSAERRWIDGHIQGSSDLSRSEFSKLWSKIHALWPGHGMVWEWRRD